MTYQPSFHSNVQTTGLTLADEMAELLPHVYTVVAEPVVRGCEFDAIVVGPAEIFVLHGSHVGRRRVDERRELFTNFLRMEFPEIEAPVQHLRIERDPALLPGAGHLQQRGGISLRQAAEIIMASYHANWPAQGRKLAAFERLIQRLRHVPDQAAQSFSEPFFFRSGGRKAHSVAEAVRMMDSVREDGIFHLRDGSLARWLEAQGATSIAQAAREAVRQYGAEPQVALESFLLETGLVDRPRLVVLPAALDLGYLLAGQKRTAHLRIEKRRGRGYLYGTVRATHPWLRISPERFKGEVQDFVVQVDSNALVIRPDAYQTTLYLVSNTTEGPLAVPVRFWVRGLPSFWHRYLLRPLAGGVLFGVVGLGLGIAGELTIGGLLPSLPVGAWSVGVGLFWAISGGLFGLRQPPVWPLYYAIRQWLMCAGRWLLVLALPVLFFLIGWRWLAAPLGLGAAPFGILDGLLLALSTAILPAAVQILWANGNGSEPAIQLPRSLWQRQRGTAALLAVILLLLVGLRYAGSTWQQYRADGTVETVQIQAEEEWRNLEAQASSWLNELTLRYYQQRRGRPTSIVPEWVQEWWRRIVY
jgi:hypothetical protein